MLRVDVERASAHRALLFFSHSFFVILFPFIIMRARSEANFESIPELEGNKDILGTKIRPDSTFNAPVV